MRARRARGTTGSADSGQGRFGLRSQFLQRECKQAVCFIAPVRHFRAQPVRLYPMVERVNRFGVGKPALRRDVCIVGGFPVFESVMDGHAPVLRRTRDKIKTRPKTDVSTCKQPLQAREHAFRRVGALGCQ